VQKEVEDQLGEGSFLTKKKDIQEPETLKTAPLSLAANGRQVKAVRTPASGKSYNPEFTAWSNRLDRLGAKEIEAEKKRLEENARDAKRLQLQEQARKDAEDEAARGLDNSDWESEWDGLQSENEGETAEWLTKKRPQRKTPVQRNKAIKRKQEEGQKKHDAKRDEKKKAQQSHMIKKLSREVKEKERLKAEQAQALALAQSIDVESSDDEDDVELKKIMPFGKAKVPEARLEVLLPEELPDSLRRLKPEGNVLHDRYRNILLQGKIETRKHAQNKKPQKLTTEKWSYKDWRLK
jgi:nucleolar protein 53